VVGLRAQPDRSFCTCKGACNTAACSCKRGGFLCTSKCHSGNKHTKHDKCTQLEIVAAQHVHRPEPGLLSLCSCSSCPSTTLQATVARQRVAFDILRASPPCHLLVAHTLAIWRGTILGQQAIGTFQGRAYCVFAGQHSTSSLRLVFRAAARATRGCKHCKRHLVERVWRAAERWQTIKAELVLTPRKKVLQRRKAFYLRWLWRCAAEWVYGRRLHTNPMVLRYYLAGDIVVQVSMMSLDLISGNL
jgi:hypothetical protein